MLKKIMSTLIAISVLSCLLSGCKSGGKGDKTDTGTAPDTSTDVTASGDTELTFQRDSEGYLEYGDKPAGKLYDGADFSYLNEMPAGQHGAVSAKDGDFIFEDGTKIKFFGVNIGFGAAFPDKDISDILAEKLAAQGVNMVRIHATDSSYYGSIIDYTKDNTQTFNEAKLDRLDYFIYALKEKGIYIHFDMVGLRTFKSGDGFEGERLDAVKTVGGVRYLRGHLFSDETVSALITDYTVNLLNHKNSYTGLTYAEEPAIAVIQYANESSITWIMPEQRNDALSRELEAGFSEWLKKKYGTTEALREAWRAKDSMESELAVGEELEKGNISAPARYSWGEAVTALSKKNTVNCRHADYMAYLIEIETAAFTAMYEAARAADYKGCINCSNFPENAVDLYFNSFGDVAEKNGYWNDAADGSTYRRTVFLTDADIVNESGHILQKLTKGVSSDMPFIVTEFNNVPLTEFKGDTLLQMASYGSLQGWDGLLIFCYTFNSGSSTNFITKTGFDDFGIMNDPAYSASMGIAASIFRLGLISEAENTVETVFTKNDILAANENYNKLASAGVFVTKISNRFIDEKYDGDADLVINSGNLANGDYSSAKHAFIHLDNLYTDPMLKNSSGDDWLSRYKEENALSYKKGMLSLLVGDRFIIDNIKGKSTVFAEAPSVILNTLLHNFELTESGEGIFSDRAVSDTSELAYDLERKAFYADSERVSVFAGRISEGFKPSTAAFSLETKNDVAAVALLSTDERALADSEMIQLFAIGRTKNSYMKWEGDTLKDIGSGPVLYQDIVGTLILFSNKETCTVYPLDASGKRISGYEGTKTPLGFEIKLEGTARYEIVLGGEREVLKPERLTITSLPETLIYKLCQPFDITGLRAEVSYSDGTVLDAEILGVSGYDPKTKGKQTIKVTYKGVSADFEITVK